MSKKFLFLNVDGDYEEKLAYDADDFVTSSAGAADAGKGILLNAAGHLDATFLNDGDISHDDTDGMAASEGHTKFPLLAGGRSFTAVQRYDVTKIFSNPWEIPDVNYVNQKVHGLDPKGSCRAATDAALPSHSASGAGIGKRLTASANGALTIDGVAVQANDRVLVKNEGGGTHVDNGIYVVINPGAVDAQWILERAVDADEDAEVTHGMMCSVVEGTINEDVAFSLVTTDPITVDTTALQFDMAYGPGTYTASYGVELAGTSNRDIRLNLLASRGLDVSSGEVGVDLQDVLDAATMERKSGADFTDDAWGPLFANDFTIDASQDRAVQASDLANTGVGKGASIIGVRDANGYWTNNQAEAVFNEIAAQIGGDTSVAFDFTEDGLVLADNDTVYAALNKLNSKWGDLASQLAGEGASLVGFEDELGLTAETNVNDVLNYLLTITGEIGNEFTAGTGGVTKGHLVYPSGNNEASVMPINAAHVALGPAAATVAAGETFRVLANDTILKGVLSGATPGTKYFWTGSGWSTSMPSGAGEYVWLGGVAINGTDIQVETTFLKKNA